MDTLHRRQLRSRPEADFDLIKVNRAREQLRRGEFRVNARDVADRLLSDHLLWRWVLSSEPPTANG